jgi:fluoride exporter
VKKLLLVCLGGALGSAARYLAGLWAAGALGAGFPAGTLLVNVTGSLLIALVMRLSLRSRAVPPDLRLFLTTGVMGGYTTYSSFCYETLLYLETGAPLSAAAYLLGTLVGCLAAGLLGDALARLVTAGAARPAAGPGR